VNIEGTRNVVEFAKAIDAGTCTMFRSIAAAGLYEGVFREDMFDEAEGLDHPYFMTKHESEKIVRKECKVPWTVYRPAMVVGDSTGEMDKIDGPYYFFKLIQRMRQFLPPWMPSIGLEGGRVNIVPVDFVVKAMDHISHGKVDGRAVLPPGRPDRLPRRRRARHLQQGRARAEDEPVRQRRAARLHPEERQEGPDGAGPGAPHPQRGDEGPGRARGHAHLRQLPHALRPPRHRRGAQGQRHRVPEPARLRLAPVGLLGAPPRPGPVHRPQPAGTVGGKVVLVTGGSSGIGLAAAHKFAEAGAITIICGRDADKLAEACQGDLRHARERGYKDPQVFSYSADMADMADCAEFVQLLQEKHGGVDFLINNAGRSIRRAIESSYDRFHDFERTMQLNYFGACASRWACCPAWSPSARATSSTSARSAC
jgi:nucleoside-diphosphate-sugar epimerase